MLLPQTLLHVYRKGSPPFRTISSLSDTDAFEVMRELYVEGSVFWERFGRPAEYLGYRRQVEQRLRTAFVQSGGSPTDSFPIYMILGHPEWFETVVDPRTVDTTEVIEIPLEEIPRHEISFTYPDSMTSGDSAERVDPDYFDPDYCGRVLTLEEVAEIVQAKGLPGAGCTEISANQPPPYIEAQVWNRAVLIDYLERTGRRGMITPP